MNLYDVVEQKQEKIIRESLTSEAFLDFIMQKLQERNLDSDIFFVNRRNGADEETV